jgi:3',5'-cyclic-AMP phosphodiesterase
MRSCEGVEWGKFDILLCRLQFEKRGPMRTPRIPRSFRAALMALACGAWALAGAPFRFGVISDVHMDLAKLKGAFRDLAEAGADTVVLVGDSCDGQPGEYAELKRFLAAEPRPRRRFFVMGNHEYYAAYHKDGGDYDEAGFPNGETSDACRKRFNRFRGAREDGPVYGDAHVAGFHFIFLAGERSRMDDPAILDDAVLTPAQLAWLRKILEADKPGGRPVFVFLHQPFQGTVSGSTTTADDASRSVQPADELHRILAGHPEAVLFTGHTHWQLALPAQHVQDASGFHLFNTSSVRDPYDAQDKPVSRSMSEGLLVEVRDGKVRVRGRDFLGRKDVTDVEIGPGKGPAAAR